MAVVSHALGQLGAVLVEHTPAHTAGLVSRAVVALPLALLVQPPNDRQVRPVADDDALETLVESLRQHGLLHPIGARPRSDGRFEVVYGSRRVLAARRLEWANIQAVLHVDLDDESALIDGVVENIARVDLTGRERAHVLRLLARIHVPGSQLGGRGAGTGKILPPPKQPNSTNGLARRLGVSPRTIYAWVGIGRAPEVLDLVEREELDWTRAGEITRAPAAVRPQLIDEVLASGPTPKARMTTLQIRARGRELAGYSQVNRAPQQSRPGAAPADSLHRLKVALDMLASIDLQDAGAEPRAVLDAIAVQVDRLRVEAGFALG